MVTYGSLLLLLLVGIVYGAPEEDLIVDLPGLEFTINYDQYSGYLQASEDRFYHYWFVESQNDPIADPVVLWLNGGPGCSSLLGFFTELGPFYIDQDGEGILRENPYSWNKNANVIFLESPACVGFSYDVNGNCTSSDDSTSLDNYNALQDFFVKFPEYQENAFYITGESYAGMYIPTLTERIVNGQAEAPMNFQGFAIGNGYFDDTANTDSEMFFAYYHSVIGEELWSSLTGACCEDGIANRESCTFAESNNPICIAYVDDVFIRMFDSGLNPYNLYSTCGSSSQNQQLNFDRERIFKRRNIDVHSRPAPLAALDDTFDPACSDNSIEIAYLNDRVTREALHIPTAVQEWSPCSRISYYEQYRYVVDKIVYVANATRGLIYNGDVDMVCDVIGNGWSINDLQLPVVEDRRTWESDGQVAGFVKRFETLDFVTFKGCGHMVPGYEPKAALHMLEAFINQEPY